MTRPPSRYRYRFTCTTLLKLEPIGVFEATGVTEDEASDSDELWDQIFEAGYIAFTITKSELLGKVEPEELSEIPEQPSER